MSQSALQIQCLRLLQDMCVRVCVCLHMVAWDLGKYNLETGSLVCTFCEKISSLEP